MENTPVIACLLVKIKLKTASVGLKSPLDELIFLRKFAHAFSVIFRDAQTDFVSGIFAQKWLSNGDFWGFLIQRFTLSVINEQVKNVKIAKKMFFLLLTLKNQEIENFKNNSHSFFGENSKNQILEICNSFWFRFKKLCTRTKNVKSTKIQVTKTFLMITASWEATNFNYLANM